jgi:hypothetical protein
VGEQHIAPLALDFLWEALEAGEPPYPLEVRAHGATVDERAALRRRVREDLVADGRMDPAGRLDPELARWLGTLAWPELSVDSVFLPDLDEPPVLALAASGRDGAVLAVQRPDGLTLREIPQDSLVSAIVGMLGAAQRGSERSISVPVREGRLTLPAGAGERTTAVETREALARLSALPNRRGGQVCVNSRTDMRGRRRSPVLSWFDNETGRYLSQTRPSPDGRDWTTIAPADAATLRHRITELTTELTTTHR